MTRAAAFLLGLFVGALGTVLSIVWLDVHEGAW